MTRPSLQSSASEIQQQFAGFQMQLMATRQTALAAQAEHDLMRARKSPRFAVEFVAQFGEDVIAWQLLGGQTSGFFIEAGAFDGHRHSVTYGFEAVGWNGLLVEPIPEKCALCRARRTGSRVVHAALSNSAITSAPFTITDDPLHGMLSYLKPADHHLARLRGAKSKSVEVPVTTLNDLLADHHATIDLVVLDVCENEIDVLRGFDLKRFSPRMLIVDDADFTSNPDIRSHLSNFNYQLITRQATSQFYIHTSQQEILARAESLKTSK